MPAEQHLILFDGQCGLCTRSVRFILRHDRRRLFTFAPLQSPLGRQLCQQAGLDPDRLETFVLVQADRVLTRSDAAIAVMRQLRGPWRLAGIFQLVPRALRDAIYRFIANRRYRWFGRLEACMMPSEQDRQRFVG